MLFNLIPSIRKILLNVVHVEHAFGHWGTSLRLINFKMNSIFPARDGPNMMQFCEASNLVIQKGSLNVVKILMTYEASYYLLR